MKQSILIAIALSFTLSAVGSIAAQPGEAVQPERKPQLDDQQGQEKACDCCKTCKEARKEIKGKEEGAPKPDACRQCCEKCAETDVPEKEKTPPEIMK